MDKQPKRRKYKDNPYEINKDSKENRYIIKFKNSIKKETIVEVSEEIYEVFNNSELKDISEMNEYDNHIEHSEVYEYNLYHRAFIHEKSVHEKVEDKIFKSEVKKAINSLPTVQKRRIKMYYFDDLNMVEIAKIEKCSKVAVKHSIDDGIAKLKVKLKNFK